jgi:hypothetical protein
MKKFIITLAAIAVGSISGCANMNETQRTTGTGAAIGAATGAVIGGLTGGWRQGRCDGRGNRWRTRGRRRLFVVAAHAGTESSDGASDAGHWR